jgi:hypothetical protein
MPFLSILLRDSSVGTVRLLRNDRLFWDLIPNEPFDKLKISSARRNP